MGVRARSLPVSSAKPGRRIEHVMDDSVSPVGFLDVRDNRTNRRDAGALATGRSRRDFST